jgi:hypothetical protein
LLETLRGDIAVTCASSANGGFLGGATILDDATSELVKSFAKIGQFERAERLIARLENRAAVASCLAELSILRAQRGEEQAAGNAEEACMIALGHPYEQDRTLRVAATALRLCRHVWADSTFERALQEARKHPESADRARSLSILAHHYYLADPIRARAVFEEAAAVAKADFQCGQEWALERIVLDLSAVEEYGLAFHWAAQFTDPKTRTMLLSGLLPCLSTNEQDNFTALEMAIAAFDEITDRSDKVTAGRQLALNLAKIRDPRGPLIFRTVQELALSLRSGDFDWALATWAPAFAQAGQVDRSKSITKRIEGPIARKQALEKSIEAVRQVGSIEEIQILAFELENDDGSVHLLTDLALAPSVREHTAAREILERAVTVASSLPESCARAEATSYIAYRLSESDEGRAACLLDEAYQAALDQVHRGQFYAQDRLAEAAFYFAALDRHQQARRILESFDANAAGGQYARKVVETLADAGLFKSACEYAGCIDGDESDLKLSLTP